MMTFAQLQGIIDRVDYDYWDFRLGGKDETTPWVQIVFADRVSHIDQHCRKWRLSYHMTELEVVNTCLLATKVAMEHELLEGFTFNGVAIYNPHMSLMARNEGVLRYELDQRDKVSG